MSKFSSEIADLANQPPNRASRRARAIRREIAAEVKGIAGNGSLRPKTKSKRLSEFDADIAQLKAYSADHQSGLQGLAPGSLSGTGEVDDVVTKGNGSVPRLAPSEAQLKSMHAAIATRSQHRIELPYGVTTKTTAIGSHLPAAIDGPVQGLPLEPTRVLEFIPTAPMATPTIRILQHTATTGAPTTVAAGGLKPEVSFTMAHVDISATKIAAHTAATDEDLADFGEFSGFLTGALNASLVNVENAQLLNGAGTGTDVLGLLNVSGALTIAVNSGASEIGIDAVERGITGLRTGSSFSTEPSVIVLHPTTFSTLRRSKNAEGVYYLNPDPTAAEATSLWGIPVCLTTQMPTGKALIADMNQAAKVYVRQGITIQSGPYNTDDFTHNLTRFVVEERIALGVARPSALMIVTGL